MYDRHVHANPTDSLALTDPEDPVVEAERALQLIEAQTGFASWKIIFPGSVVLSPRLCEIFGQPPAHGAIPLQEMVKLYHPDDRGKLLSMIALSLDGKRGFRCRLRAERADGELRVIETIGDLRIRDGKVTGLFGASRDVTAEIDRELAISGRLRLIQDMVAEMPCPVAIMDERLRVMDCSIMWLKAHRFIEKREVVGKSLPQLFGGLAADVAGEYERALKAQTVKTKRSFISPTTNQPVLCNAVVSPWYLGDKKVGGIVVAIGWSEIAVARGGPSQAPQPEDDFDGSLLDMLKTVTS